MSAYKSVFIGICCSVVFLSCLDKIIMPQELECDLESPCVSPLMCVDGVCLSTSSVMDEIEINNGGEAEVGHQQVHMDEEDIFVRETNDGRSQDRGSVDIDRQDGGRDIGAAGGTRGGMEDQMVDNGRGDMGTLGGVDNPGPPLMTQEVCNGLDDDQDGFIDNMEVGLSMPLVTDQVIRQGLSVQWICLRNTRNEPIEVMKTEASFELFEECVNMPVMNRGDDEIQCSSDSSRDGIKNSWLNQIREHPFYEGLDHESIVKKLPVVEVSAEDAIQFGQWLSMRDSTYVYRLPTKNEWQQIARSNSSGRLNQLPNLVYPWGMEEIQCRRAIFKDSTDGCGINRPHLPCEEFMVNSTETDTIKRESLTGVCDLIGNVAEIALNTSADSEYTALGGDWKEGNTQKLVISTSRDIGEESADNKLGFRLVRKLRIRGSRP